MRRVAGSLRGETNFDCPGRRRSRSVWMSASTSGMPGGQPSITQPIAGPWLSPKVVMRNMWPNVLKDISVAEVRFRTVRQSHDSGVRRLVALCLLRRKAEIMRPDRPHRAVVGDDDRVSLE